MTRERAERIAWIGAGVVMACTGTIGLVAAALPHLWMDLFTTDADVLAAGSAYLRIVGPAFGLYGFGAALYFGSHGFGRLLWPVSANIVRLAIAAGGGWFVTRWLGGGTHALFATIAAAFVVYGAMIFAAIRAGAWRR